MSKFSFEGVRLEVEPGSGKPAEPRRPEAPFRIAVIGDFGGKGNRSGPELAKPVLIDRDNFDSVLKKLDVQLDLPIGDSQDASLTFAIERLEHFEPEKILQRLPLFQDLIQARDGLADRQGAEPAARSRGRERPDEAALPDPSQLSLEGLLDDAVEATQSRTEAESPTAGRRPDALGDFLKKVTAGQSVHRPDPRTKQLANRLEQTIGEGLREMLHHPQFQALEAAWRGLHLLVRRLPTGVSLKLYLVDLPKRGLKADLAAHEDLRQTEFYKLLVESWKGVPGQDPWSLVVANHFFDSRADDALLLGKIAAICQQAKAPFLAGARSGLLGCREVGRWPDPSDWNLPIDSEAAEAWKALRELPQSTYAGLLFPRFLLRLPYGRDSEPLESLDFEEMPGPPRHEHYLWGNPAFAAGLLIGQSFARYGWDLQPGALRKIDDLPAHVYQAEDESLLKPCAEALLGERATQAIAEAGIMPLLSVKGSDQAVLARFHSISARSPALAGPWRE